MKITVFFHIANQEGWKPFVDGKISLLKKYGLWDEADEIIFICHYEPKEFEELSFELTKDPRIKAYLCIDSVKPYGESYSNRLIKVICDQYSEPRAILRFHTKGLSYYNHPNEEGAKRWSEYLEYWNIEQWKNCVRLIEEGYDTVGTNWRWYCEPPHYGSNIYWASSEYIKKLPLWPAPHENNFLPQTPGVCSLRHDAEPWVSAANPKFYNWHDWIGNQDLTKPVDPSTYRLDAGLPMKLPIRIYYHVADLPYWEELVESKIVLMKKCGLWNRAQEIIFLGHYIPEHYDGFKQRHGSDPRVRIWSDTPGRPPYGECYSNRMMWWDIMHRPDPVAVLRFHTKGLVYLKGPKGAQAQAWNDYFDYWLIERWRDCHQALEEGYDLAGVNWHEPRHFSGNLWWARSDYIRRLPYLKAPHENNFEKQIPYTLSTRHDAESWVGLVQDAKVKEFHHYEHTVIYEFPPPDPKDYKT